jgi:hypothetical protein
MLRGPEAYLQMWERAVGVPSSHCMGAHRHFSRRGLGKLVLGQRSKRILTHAGQPIHRTRTWSWCVKGKRGANASQAVVMTPHGKAALVASSARGQELFGVAPGDSASTLDGAERLGAHVFTRKLDKHHTLAYSVGGGEVKAVALAGPKAAESDHTLRSYLTKLPAKGVEARPDTVVTAASSKVSPGKAVPLVAQDGGGQFPYFCGL